MGWAQLVLWTCLHLPVRTFRDEQICGQMLRLWRRHLQGTADPILFTGAEENGHQPQTDSRKTLEVTLSTLSPESDCRCQRTLKPERWLWKELLPSGHLELNFHFSLTLSFFNQLDWAWDVSPSRSYMFIYCCGFFLFLPFLVTWVWGSWRKPVTSMLAPLLWGRARLASGWETGPL